MKWREGRRKATQVWSKWMWSYLIVWQRLVPLSGCSDDKTGFYQTLMRDMNWELDIWWITHIVLSTLFNFSSKDLPMAYCKAVIGQLLKPVNIWLKLHSLCNSALLSKAPWQSANVNTFPHRVQITLWQQWRLFVIRWSWSGYVIWAV